MKPNLIHINKSALICATEVALACLYNTYTITVDCLVKSETEAKVVLELDYTGLDSTWEINVSYGVTADEFRVLVMEILMGIEETITELENRPVSVSGDPTIGKD